MTKPKISIKDSIFNFFELIIIACAVFFLVNTLLGQLLKISGDSMLPNFKDGEQLISEKISLRFKELERGDVVIFEHPTIKNRLVVKRIIGLPNEIFLISDGHIIINGKKLEEHYLPSDTKTQGRDIIKDNEKIHIPNNSYILLGDNRDESSDSRTWGVIKKEDIVGRAFFIYYPLKSIRFVF